MYRDTKEFLTPQKAPEAPRRIRDTRKKTFKEIADAMRRGCELRPKQAFGTMFEQEHAACALGAAVIGGMREHRMTQRVRYSCGCWPTQSGRLNDVIVHLNDDHRKTREDIADWIETLD